jgi:hypothetical protein
MTKKNIGSGIDEKLHIMFHEWPKPSTYIFFIISENINLLVAVCEWSLNFIMWKKLKVMKNLGRNVKKKSLELARSKYLKKILWSLFEKIKIQNSINYQPFKSHMLYRNKNENNGNKHHWFMG